MDELARYIFNYYSYLMTTPEKAAHRSIIAQAKVQSADQPGTKKLLTDLWISNDPRVLALLSDGPDAFMARVSDRIMRERRNEVFVNNCPRCGGLARTPRAKQCPKCFFSWHEDSR